MKQILLVLGLMCAVMGVQAQNSKTYVEDLEVVVNEETAPTQQAVINVVFHDQGSMDLTVKNFILQSPNQSTGEVDMMPVGDITVTGVSLTPADGYSTFGGSQSIVIADGDNQLSPYWVGPNLGSLLIVYNGQVNDEHIYVNIDIDLTATLQQVVKVRVGNPLKGTQTAKYQIDNSDFEAWDDLGTKNEEPTHWNSFQHADGSLAPMVASQQVARSTEVRPGSEGQYSARIYARDLWITVAQGNLTTGRINAASMSAADAEGNYNFTQTDNPDFNQPLTGLPDSLRVWVRASCAYNASVSCVLHTDGYYQDPEANEITAQVIATAKDNTIAKSSSWQCITIPFTYTLTDGTRPAYALLTLTTSGQPGRGNAKDEMLIDDLEMVYNSELASAIYKGQALQFDKDNNVALPADAPFDSSALTLTTNGRGATVECEFTPTYCGPNSGILLITVKGDDYAVNPNNIHCYSITFCDDTTPVERVATQQTGTGNHFDLNGRPVKQLNKAGVYIRDGQKVVLK